MAGSQKQATSVPSCADPILGARLEAIKQLAGGSSDRVAVLDRDFNVIYTNESAWSKEASPLSDRSAKCYEAFAHRNDPCGTCPVTKLYESPEVQSVACSIRGDSNCLDCQARRGASACHEASVPTQTADTLRLPYSVSQPCDAGSAAHATVRACSECRRDDPRCPTVFEDLGTIGLSRLGCLKTYRESTLN